MKSSSSYFSNKKKMSLNSTKRDLRMEVLEVGEKGFAEKAIELEGISKNQMYIFDIMMSQWCSSPFSKKHSDITRLITVAALIPGSTAEAERSFSLMKLVCTKLRNSLSTKSIGQLMRICKFGPISDGQFDEIFEKWMRVEETASGKRRVASRLKK